MHRLLNFPRPPKVNFTFDGRIVEGHANESLAAAILASGRNVLSRSLRFHRPRSMFCSTGECGWCAVEIDGVPSVHACTMSCREGLAVRSQNAWPSAEHDLFSGLDVFSPWLPATFYHHRFLWPRGLRQLYLRVLRFFTGMARLPVGTDGGSDGARSRRKVEMETDVAVVGAGPAGMRAALAAAEGGARVLLIDDKDSPGGSWRGHGDSQDPMNELLSTIRGHPDIEVWSRSIVLGMYAQGKLGVVTPDRLGTVRAREVILASGALDALPLFVNNDLPGVMSARLVERLITTEGMRPGKRAILWGGEPLVERTSKAMASAGIEIVRRLAAGEVIVSAKGSDRVRGAVIRTLDGEQVDLNCDLIVIAMLQPRLELLRQAGAEVRWEGNWVPVLDRWLQASVPGLSIIGEAAGATDWEQCVREGRLAGTAAANRLNGRAEVGDAARDLGLEAVSREPVPNLPSSSHDGESMLCFCEDVRERELRAEMEHGYSDPELVKRRTGALTGPCQGKYCLANFMRVCGGAGAPTARPPAKPVRLGDLLPEG